MRHVSCGLALIAAAGLMAGPRAAHADVYGFELQGPSTALNPDDGGSIAVTGSGKFNTDTGDILAGGNYSVYDADGVLVDRGTWGATDFVSFVSTGGATHGFTSGLLEMFIAVRSNDGTVTTDIPMDVLCVPEDPGPEPPEPGHEGVTVGPFTQRHLGFTLFHKMKP